MTSSYDSKIKLDKPFALKPQSIVEYFYYEGWNRKSTNAIKQCMSDSIKFRGGLTTSRMKKFTGRNGFIEYMIAAHTALEGNNCEIIKLVINPDNKTAAARICIKGIHRGVFFGVPSELSTSTSTTSWSSEGHEISYDGTAFFTFNDDCTQIIELWALADVDSLKNQIGATSESVFM